MLKTLSLPRQRRWQKRRFPGWAHDRYRASLTTLTDLGLLKLKHKGGRGPHDPRLFGLADA
jgi:hypothetical protein